MGNLRFVKRREEIIQEFIVSLPGMYYPTFPVLASTTGDPPSYLIESKRCSGSPPRPK